MNEIEHSGFGVVLKVFELLVIFTDYVRELQQNGRLKEKPIVYYVFTTMWLENNDSSLAI